MALFGLPFFLAGVFLALTGSGLVPMQSAPDAKWTPVLLGLMSLVFLCVGGGLMLGRKWLTLDFGSGSLVRSRGLLIPMQSEERHFSEFSAVVIAFQAGDSDSADRFPVRLRALTGKDFDISSPTQFAESRKLAEYLSRAVRLPLADTITDHETIAPPERAADSLRERLRSAGPQQEERAMPPSGMRSEVSTSRGYASIVIPGGKGLLVGGMVSLLPVLVLLVAIPTLMRFFSQTNTPPVVQILFVGFLTLIFGIPSMIGSVNRIVESHRKKTTVTASSEGLVIERQGAWSARTETIPADDLLDLDLSTINGTIASAKSASGLPALQSPGAERLIAAAKRWVPTKGIIAKSRKELVAFGEGLSAEELQYLNSVLRKALAGR
jgi:hypothetical protein